jgi:hypothetical protein
VRMLSFVLNADWKNSAGNVDNATDPVSAFFNNVTKNWQMLARPRGSDRRIASHNLPADLSGYSNTSLPQLMLDTDGSDSPV